MASVICEKRNGKRLYRVQFYDKDGKRRSIRLSDVNAKGAESICARVASLVSASISGAALDNETSAWLADLGDELRDKLANVGLATRRESARLEEFLEWYIASRTDAKPNTLRNLKMAQVKMVEFFGKDRELRTISVKECDDWRQTLVDKYSTATLSMYVKRAKRFFKVAMRRQLIDANPFAELKGGSEKNDARLKFIDRPTITKVLEACPDHEWKLIVALSRYGGLRTPSETLALKWTDVDWERKRMNVPSPKTERQGKPHRVVPMFQELQPFLEAAFDQAPEGAVYVISRYRGDVNLRTHFERIIRRAGVQAWERLFHNMRASRQTELTDIHPAHVVADWLGNTEAVARRHYLQVTEEHFQRALAVSSGATGGAVVVQQVVLQANATKSSDEQEMKKPRENRGKSAKLVAIPLSVHPFTVPPTGIEPVLPD